MSDEKSQTNDQQTKSNGETQSAWASSFQEMMGQMMANCNCRLEEMGAMWTACCGKLVGKQEKDHDL